MVSAWVFVIWGDPKYLVGAVVAAASLRRVRTVHHIVLLHTNDISEYLPEKVFTKTKRVDLLTYHTRPMRTQKQAELYAGDFNRVSCTKWQCMGLSEYQKVMFLDADLVFQRNCDFLMSMQSPAATFTNPFNAAFARGGFHDAYGHPKHTAVISRKQIEDGLERGNVAAASMVLLTPGTKVLEEYKTWMGGFTEDRPYGHPGCFSGADEQSITEFLGINKKQVWRHIDPIYQAIPWKKNWLPGVDILKRAFALHYYHSKCWESGPGAEWPDTDAFWKIYHQFEKDFPQTAKRIRSLITYYR
jgi:hypothetical protein